MNDFFHPQLHRPARRSPWPWPARPWRPTSRPPPVQNAQIDDFAAGQEAIDAKNWSEAVSSFNKVVAKNPKNADAYNYLGYSNRWLGSTTRLLPPTARPWHWTPSTRARWNIRASPTWKTNQKAQADAQLAKLQAICAGCEETLATCHAGASWLEYKPAAK